MAKKQNMYGHALSILRESIIMPTTDFRVIPYSPELVITNLESLPAGTGAKYLEVLEAHNGTYIAVQWRRTLPKTIGKGRLLIEFP